MTSLTRNAKPFVTTSINNGRGGRLRIRIYVPKAWQASEQQIAADHIHELSVAYDEDRPESPRTQKWLKSLPDAVHARLSKHGLCEERGALRIQRLREFLEWCIEQSAIGKDGKPVAPTTIEVYRRAARNLLAFFRPNQHISKIKPSDARNYRNWLLTSGNAKTGKGLGETTANSRCKKAKEWFELAKQNEWIDRNPFAELRGLRDSPGRRPDDIVYVAASKVEDLIDYATDNEWRLLLALWRYAGLRQLEPMELEVKFVSWEKSRMTVLSPKNQRYPNKYKRVIPIWPEIEPFLLKQCEAANEANSKWLIFRRRYEYDKHKGTTARAAGSTIRNRLEDQMLRQGIPPWPDLFRALRSSGETDRLNQRDEDGNLTFNPAQIAYWWNHSERTQKKHYYTIEDAAFEVAVKPNRTSTRTRKSDERVQS